VARTPDGTAQLEETEKSGNPCSDRRSMPAGAKQELLDGGIAQAQVIRDLSQGTRLDRPLPERVPLTAAQLPEYGADEIALDNRGFWIDVARIGYGIRRDRLHPVVPPQHVEAMILCGGDEPRPHSFRCGAPAQRLDRFKEHLLRGVGGILWFA
jgi:hypothetical protein